VEGGGWRVEGGGWRVEPLTAAPGRVSAEGPKIPRESVTLHGIYSKLTRGVCSRLKLEKSPPPPFIEVGRESSFLLDLPGRNGF
jgi:hypothetical protein